MALVPRPSAGTASALTRIPAASPAPPLRHRNLKLGLIRCTYVCHLEKLAITVHKVRAIREVGGRNPAQNGYGASIGTIDLDMSTKNYTPTGPFISAWLRVVITLP